MPTSHMFPPCSYPHYSSMPWWPPCMQTSGTSTTLTPPSTLHALVKIGEEGHASACMHFPATRGPGGAGSPSWHPCALGHIAVAFACTGGGLDAVRPALLSYVLHTSVLSFVYTCYFCRTPSRIAHSSRRAYGAWAWRERKHGHGEQLNGTGSFGIGWWLFFE
jgi:hypothetical protein